jgi:branched-chain amino acid transport system permease protein
MIRTLRRSGLAVVALVAVTIWLLPLVEAISLLVVLALIPVLMLALARVNERVKLAAAPILRFRYIGVALLAIGIALPHFSDLFTLRLYSELLILGLLTMSLDVMMGYVGLASFAHAALSGIAAYTVAITLNRLQFDPWLAILAGIVVGTVATTIMGAFSVRVRDIYFGIITLVFGNVFFIIANTWVSVTNGEDGLTIRLPELSVLGLFTVDASDLVHFWYLTLAVVFASFIVLRLFLKSPIGLVFQGIRDNEERTRYLGYDVNHFKILSTAVSGFFASLAGILLLLKNAIIGTEQLFMIFSGEIVIWAVIGGLGTLVGPFIGAAFVQLITDFLTEFTERHLLVIGLIFIVTILLAPRGLVGALNEAWRGGKGNGETKP